MFVFGNLFAAVARLLDLVLTLYIWVVIARAVVSWVGADPYNPIVVFLRRVTDPLLYHIRRFVPPIGAIDISPLILILLVWLVKSFVVSTLFDIAAHLR